MRKQNPVKVHTLIKKFLPYLKPDIGLIVGTLFALAILVAAEMTIPILIRNTVDVVVQNADKTIRIAQINRITIQYIVIITAILIFTFLQNYTTAVIGQRFIFRVRSTLFRHISMQRYAFFHTQPIGKLMSKITNDVEGIQELFSNILTALLRNITTLIGTVVTMGIINMRLTLFTLAAFPIIIPISLLFNRALRIASLATRAEIAKLMNFISEHISGMHIVQIFSKTIRDARWFDKKNKLLQQKTFREVYTNAIFRPLLDILSALLIAYIFILSGILHSGGTVSVGVVVAFLSLISRFFQQLTSIADTSLTIQSGLSGLERIAKVLDYKQQLDVRHVNRQHVITEGRIEFHNVSFSYTETDPVIADISFSIRPGETVALVGYTGSGKTTIANLLSRLWDVDSGTITIDGHNINSIHPAELYRNVVTSGQQVSLFDESIRENITMGNNMNEEQIREIAKMVHADEFIQKLPEKYNTQLSEGGNNQLSFGQQQLIIFARIIACEPKIIILDEATSSIDSKTESHIQNALHSVLADKSALIIAHRLSTVKNANRILCIADGRIVAEGSHAELMKQKGYYARLWHYQTHNQNTLKTTSGL